MKYHLMLEFTTEIMWVRKYCLCVSRENRLLRRYFPKQKLNFPFSFQLKKC